jgi:hypothetical protein
MLAVAGLLPLDKYPLGFCVFKKITGFPCPTCGFTRAFCSFASGNWAEGVYLCPFALIVFILVALACVYNAVVITLPLFGLRNKPEFLRLSQKKMIWMAVVLFLLIMANWIYRLVMGLS